MLIDYGFKVNQNFSVGMLIHLAINYTRDNAVEMTLMLLRKGASLKRRLTPLECALKKKYATKYDIIKVVTYHQHSA